MAGFRTSRSETLGAVTRELRSKLNLREQIFRIGGGWK
jgi:hypothetical protein